MNRRNSVSLKIMFCLLLVITGRQLTQAQAPTFTVQTAPVLHSNMNCYWIYRPQNYAADVTTNYPLIVFFHGVGESGNGATAAIQNKTWVWGPGKLMQNGTFPTSFVVGGNTYRFLAICPQIKLGLDNTHPDGLTDTIQPALVDAAIEYMKANFRVDVTRIYLCGLSMGGGATLHYAGSSATFANKLAAIAAACPARTLSVAEANVIGAAKLPVLLTHNADDATVAQARTATAMTRLNAYTPAPPRAAKKIQWSSGGHNVWQRTYENIGAGVTTGGFVGNVTDTMSINIYTWMLQFTRTAGGIAVLPVVWKSFMAQEANGNISLNWTVTGVKNIASFTVERSDDGVNWSPVKTLAAQKSNGSEQQYQYIDESGITGNVFYRIKQTDLDGTSTYSEIRKINAGKKPFSVKIFPSPFDQKLTVRLSEVAGNVIVKLVNSSGSTIVKQQHYLNNNETTITIDNIKQIGKGVYYVVIENADGSIISRTQVLKR